MLVINGVCENGVFVPERPLVNIKGRQRAILNIDETNQDENLNAWREFSRTIRTSTETLEGEPQKIRLKTPQEIETL